jgi:F-type H+-transporting ATPase subunit c
MPAKTNTALIKKRNFIIEQTCNIQVNNKMRPWRKNLMDSVSLIGMGSVITAGLTIGIGAIGPALGEGRAVAQGLASIAQQPDESNTITRTLFVGLAMIESTAIYAFVVSMILLFANPFWDYVVSQAGG